MEQLGEFVQALRSREALRDSEARYRAVLESQTDLVCRYLPDTTLTFVNEAYCRSFGRRREELIGRPFLDLLPAAARDAIVRTSGKDLCWYGSRSVEGLPRGLDRGALPRRPSSSVNRRPAWRHCFASRTS